MAQSVSHVLTETCPSPTTYDDNSNNANDIYSCKQDDTKALGYLILHVQESIRVKYDTLTSAKALWDVLSIEYGTQGVSTTYGKSKAMLDTPIPSNQHPASIITMDKEMMTPAGIEKAAVLCWEQADNSCGKHKEVQKLSAVKRKQPDPKFNQQQPPKQGGGNNAGAPAQNKGKNKHCGTCGGKNRHQNNHDHAHLASTVNFTTPTIVDIPSINDPRRLAHTPGAQFFEPSFKTICSLDKIAASSIAPYFKVEPTPKHLCLEDHLSATIPAYDDDTVSLGSDYIEDDIYNMYSTLMNRPMKGRMLSNINGKSLFPHRKSNMLTSVLVLALMCTFK
ncbi:hypothetical protein PAXINDRAFT_15106 [Paxillus involutus ATCC 200175]|uniref:Uncharacterized protein n=1 Tax=Paxillus involutus ATCC 200175 TaxID=664439 RepID=A0A0C9TWL2_PAXIN|nr:hypothetical protein PAXINDRAFT_15106 [Paxillus involutus ATCC 200175]